MNSGKNGQALKGSWGDTPPVVRWRAWYWEDGLKSTGSWSELPDTVLLIYLYHPNGARTRMAHVDEYPPPPGVVGPCKPGYQIGEVNSLKWFKVREEIEAQS